MKFLAQRKDGCVFYEVLGLLLPVSDGSSSAPLFDGKGTLKKALDISERRLEAEVVAESILNTLLELHLREVQVRIAR